MTNWDRLAASTPINKAAAVVRDGRGKSWQPEAKLQNVLEMPPRMVENLHGRRVGRLTVVGLRDPDSKEKRLRWVCRCDCGRYITTGLAGFRKLEKDPARARCGECDYTDFVKQGRIVAPKDRPEAKAAVAARKLAERERRDAIVHPELQRLASTLPVTKEEFLVSVGGFIQNEAAARRDAQTQQIDGAKT